MQEPGTPEEGEEGAPEVDSTPESGTAAAEPTSPILLTKRLSKRLRGRPVLNNVSITVREGQVYSLLGAQGAGKTTLVHLALGFLEPDGGEVHLLSGSLQRAKMRVGYMPQRSRFHTNISGRDYLKFHAGLSGLGGRDAKGVANEAGESVGLGDSLKRRIGSYSREQLRKLALAVALVSGGAEPPDLLILDEPTAGLVDDLGADIREVVLRCRERGSTVLICSHSLTPVERLSTNVGILRAGRLIAQTPVDETPRINLVGLPREGALEITSDLFEYLKRLHDDTGIAGGQSADEPLTVSLPTGPSVPRSEAIKAAALRAMIDARWDIVSVYIESRDIESLFHQAVPARPRPEEKVKAPATAPLRISAGTTPLASGEPSGVSTDRIEEAEEPRIGPSTSPLGEMPAVPAMEREDQLEEDGSAPQLEPRPLRSRANGTGPEPENSDEAAGEEQERDVALAREGS
jgi:ABC-2 type transport system ATP-binding protein